MREGVASAATFESVVEAILAGQTAEEILPMLEALTSYDRQAVLCTVCAMRKEIATNCTQNGADVESLLSSQCPLFVNGVPTCLLEAQTQETTEAVQPGTVPTERPTDA